ncbi:MAG: S8 family serine peptidase [Verrucomicrobiota bacterium]|nr:S8 family serine peptidase [Verrucomicrobiota bacterium]
MKQKTTIYTVAAAGAVLALLVFLYLFYYAPRGDRLVVEGAGELDPIENSDSLADLERAMRSGTDEDVDERLPFRGFANRVIRRMLEALLSDPSAIRKEAVLTFNSDEAYQRFLNSLGGRNLRLLGSSDSLRSVRLGFDKYEDFANALATLDPNETSSEMNYLVSLPLPPEHRNSPGAGSGAIPFGRNALESLGISGDHSAFGRGVLVAVLDSGIQDHVAFSGKVIRELDYVRDGNGKPVPIDIDNGHGTAVASIIAGSDPLLPGVAPSAGLLSYRILDNEGYTNSFTLAEAIVSAADEGADIINVSLGSTGDSALVRQAVDYANSKGALIVAATGNDGLDQVTYPAAIDGVIAVSAVDARGQHLDFANSGASLESGGMAAPGYGVVAAWPDGQASNFSGTSASAPYVSGAVAAVMSENPGMSAQAAYELLMVHSNEAGAPGSDDVYGSGNLNIGRVLNRNSPGIVDVAVASYYYDPLLALSNGTENIAQVIVENRGTEPLHNVSVDINSGDGARTYNVAFIPAGESYLIPAPINAAAGRSAGQLEVSATASVNPGLNDPDLNPGDNSLSTRIEFREESAP